MNRTVIVLLGLTGVVLLAATASAFSSPINQECEDACISGSWEWCEWDPNPDATCNPDDTCPAPTTYFYCGGSGCCE